MTTSTTNKTPSNKPVATNKVADKPAEESIPAEKTTVVERIPSTLSENSLLADFCRQYLSSVDEITTYNKEVLAASDSEWTPSKVMEKARSLGRNDDVSKVNKSVSDALDTFERLAGEYAKARKAVLDATSKELGITLSATAERNPETEAPLKEKRKHANEIGSQLTLMANMMTDKTVAASVKEFFDKNPLPAIGRDQVHTFSNGGSSTPKYRVTVKITNSAGETLLEEDGFTKTAMALTKPAFKYERGNAPKSDTLRAVWEKAGNTSDKTVQPTVEFDDNDLHFVITKK